MKRIFKNYEVATALSLYAFGFDQTKKADEINLNIKGRIDGESKEAKEVEISVELVFREERKELKTASKRSGKCLSCSWVKHCVFEPVEDYFCHSDNCLERSGKDE
jgi:hypothetical protein